MWYSKNTYTDYVISIVTVMLMGSCTMSSNTDTVVKEVKTTNLYSQTVKDIESVDMNLFQFKSKPVLFVNIATKCGYTGQLDGLEALYQTYKAKGLKVVGVPSNDFGGQTPEDAKGVKSFCKLNYGVTFPLTEKLKVVGDEQAPFAKWLTTNSKEKSPIIWNFEKFLVNSDGEVVKRFASSVKPMDQELTSEIEKLLL